MFKMRNLLIALCLMLVAIPAFAQSSTPEATPAATEAASEYTLGMSTSPTLGKFMVGPNGMTLYTFTVDTVDNSNCSGKCLQYWPPLIVKSASDVTADEGFPGVTGTITRSDGTIQVTYNGWPLYYFANDKAVGDTKGQGVTNNWWIVPPATIAVSKSDSLGNVLVGPKGMTVYTFAKDTAGATTSACTGQCATAWPAVTVADESDVLAGVNVHGVLGTIDAANGTYQVTYNGWPLYYFAKDAKIGDTMGDGVGKVWSAVAPETVVISKDATLGNILVAGTGGHTVYTFAKDAAGATTSACTGDCATNWPAVTVGANDRLADGVGITGKLATITAPDGKSLQVTYNGMPLYYFKMDTAAGDTKGSGVGGVWNVVKP